MSIINTRFLDHDYRNYYIPDYSILFFTNHKAAVSSLKRYSFSMYAQSPNYDPAYGDRAPKVPFNNIGNSRDIFKVMIVRNPWDRIVSCYTQKKKDNKRDFFNYIGLDLTASFHDFVNRIAEIPDYKSDRHFRSQYTHITWLDGSLLSDYLIRFSHIQEDITRLENIRSIPKLLFPHNNKSKDVNYTDFYNEELRNIIAVRYKIDIELFGYEYGKVKTNPIDIPNTDHLSSANQMDIINYKAMRSIYFYEYMAEKTTLKPKSFKSRLRYLMGK